jgi:hypothetical protein
MVADAKMPVRALASPELLPERNDHLLLGEGAIQAAGLPKAIQLAQQASDRGVVTAEQQHPHGVVDAHLMWERQLTKLGARDLSRVDEPTIEAVCDQIAHLERLILDTPARTLAGVMAQLRRVVASMAQNDEGEREQRGLQLALATLAQLHVA